MTTAIHPSVLVDRSIVKAHLLAGMTFFMVVLLAGLLYGLQLQQLYPFPGVELLSPGRVRMVHTNGAAFGFLVNCFAACLYWVIPRLTGQPVFSRRLSWVVFWAWQALVGVAAAGILLGEAQAVEWGETPTWIDPFILVGAALLIFNLIVPIFKRRDRNMYVTLWYYTAGFVWLALVYFMGNFLPQYWLSGAAGAAVVGLYIHDLVGLFVTPMGWGLMYYFVPVILKKPIWSHTLSLVGFWGLAFFYPLNGIHHFLFSPIPMYAQYGAVISTIAVEIVVFTVIVNFFMTLRGSGDAIRTNMPIRWFYSGMVLYFTTCLQCAFHTTLTFQRIIHFTDWVVGHAHLVMFGVFGFWLLGVVDYLWPRLTKREWASDALRGWHYWSTTLGLVLMFLSLTLAGLVQGYMWKSLALWEESIIASQYFWAVRTFSGVMIIGGQFLLFINMWLTSRAPAPAPDLATAAAGEARA
ncbi:MAG: cbb3-type cytochrome c oxidase subunit I [Candidatus Binatia bacterium]